MGACKFLNGENLAPLRVADARKLIGKRVTYLREIDIDRSGRGYFFPRHGEVSKVARGEVDMGNDNWEYLRSIIELVVVE